VVATTAIGAGPASDPSAAVTPHGPGVPGTPTGVTAVAGDGAATVTWSAPADDGGSPITAYTVTSSPDDRTVDVDGSSTSAAVDGLTNDVSYTFTVTATNDWGAGPASDPSAAVTPSCPPPRLDGFSPGAARVGMPVTVIGAHLISAQEVRFSGVDSPFRVVSDTEITTTVPAGAVTGPIDVVTPDGSASTQSAFGVMPTVSSFTPTSGPRNTVVIVSGSAFIGTRQVLIGDRKTAFTVTAYGSLSFTVPRRIPSGHIFVVTPSGRAKSQEWFTVTTKRGGQSHSAEWWRYSAPPISRL
jgi:hypothetical protein